MFGGIFFQKRFDLKHVDLPSDIADEKTAKTPEVRRLKFEEMCPWVRCFGLSSGSFPKIKVSQCMARRGVTIV